MTFVSRLAATAAGLLPQGPLSRAARSVVRTRSAWAAQRFAAAYGIDLAEAETPPGGFTSVHDVFTRRLLAGARPLDPNPAALLSPVDGTVADIGPVDGDRLPEAKGRTYSLKALLTSAELAERFAKGSYLSLYLSPRDYHRVHAPCGGAVERWLHVPGRLFLVHPKATQHVDSVFARNERLITLLNGTPFGDVAVIMVGSLLVGHMRLSFLPEVSTNDPNQRAIRGEPVAAPKRLERGDELGWFEQGSTVLVLTERPVDIHTTAGATTRMGQALGMARAVGTTAADS